MERLEIGSKYIQQQKRVEEQQPPLSDGLADFNGRTFIIRLERFELHTALFSIFQQLFV